jgi:signal transduction histidine kinase/DNA-binding response OmpR family regulator
MDEDSGTNDRREGRQLQRLTAVVAELKLLNDIALAASGALSMDAVLEMIIEKSLKALNAEQGSLLLVTGESKAPLKTYIRQDNRSKLHGSYHAGTHITGYVLHHRKPLLIHDLSADGRFDTVPQEWTDIKSVLCVPIITQTQLIGVMMMINKKDGIPFTDDDQRLLMILATQAGQLIANARLVEESTRKQEELATARIEAEKWRELDQLKSRFFADISHELRTPLTLILGPTEQLIAGSLQRDVTSDYHLIRRNARRLLRLINELLDLARLEAGSLKLHVSPGNIVSLAASIIESFQPLADGHQIALRLTSASDRLDAWLDYEKVETILYNLLSNALKFTPDNGTVTLVVEPTPAAGVPAKGVRITVADSGRGIPPEKLRRLFERYYQAEERDHLSGSGLGLALTKGLVETHHGSISVESSPGQGTLFTVELPADRTSFSPEEIATYEVAEGVAREGADVAEDSRKEPARAGSGPEEPDAGLPLVLLVEDDAALRRHLRDGLKGEFRIYEASDGDVGLSIARDVIPDIVISDIAMPGMTGIELCVKLKNDERTSHIPVLLLTADAAHDKKIQGLRTGADDYVTKPFDWQELTTRVRNLIDSRRRLRERFSNATGLKPSEIATSSMDEIFLERVMQTVERAMGDENFSVEELARDIGMSYSQLHRKLTALVNQSPNHFIRSMRLQRAKDLLERNAATVSEIAYTVGFASPAYFTKCFHQQFGIVPSGVKKKADSQDP